MRTLVCGDRHMTDKQVMATTLASHPITIMIEGEAAGADTLARLWAEEHNIPVLKFPANWKQYGRAAGPIRNKQMLVEGKPELVIAFLAPNSVGTRNMIQQARAAKLPVVVIHLKG